MVSSAFRSEFEAIFESYGSSYSKVGFEKLLKQIKDSDEALPFGSMFFTVSNAQSLKFEFISKNVEPCLGMNANTFGDGLINFAKRIHPDDFPHWTRIFEKLTHFTKNRVPKELRANLNYTYNYRFKNGFGEYVNLVEQVTPLVFDDNELPVISLTRYFVLDSGMALDVIATIKLLNTNNQLETLCSCNFTKQSVIDTLSKREVEIVGLLLIDKSSKEIAKTLNIAANTVDTHRRNILNKLNIKSTHELKATVGNLSAHI